MLQNQKYVKANSFGFMIKDLRKEIMQRSTLQNIFLQERADEEKALYNKQKDLCLSLLRKTMRNYFRQLNTNTVSDSRTFWKTVSPLFSEKAFHSESIALKENNEIVTSETLNKFFNNAVKNLGIMANLAVTSTLDTSNPIFSIVKNHENHPSILRIKKERNYKKLSFCLKFINKSN